MDFRDAGILVISCDEVRRELSNYIEGDLDAGLRMRIENHLQLCRHCTAILDGLHNLLFMLGTGEVFDLPAGFSSRLYKRLVADA